VRTRVKICGITRHEDALAAARLGADALGLVFYAPSPRSVDAVRAREILRGLPPFVTVVGLFVNAARYEIERMLREVPIDLLQFHGEESPQDCEAFGRPYVKAVRMREGVDLAQMRAVYRGASALLLDAYRPGAPGGTGMAFDWDRIPGDLSGEIILAGGLSPDNVATAIRRVRPYAVDVSGGVERSKGVKDASKIAAFLRGVQRGNDS